MDKDAAVVSTVAPEGNERAAAAETVVPDGDTHAAVVKTTAPFRDEDAAAAETAVAESKAEKRVRFLEDTQESLKGMLRTKHRAMCQMAKFVKVECCPVVEQSLEGIVRNGWDSVTWKRGYTLLHYVAECQEDLAVVEMVANLAPETNMRDDSNMRPVDYARKSGHDAVAQLLERLQNDVRRNPRPLEGSHETPKTQEAQPVVRTSMPAQEGCKQLEGDDKRLSSFRPELQRAIQAVIKNGWSKIKWPHDFTALHLAARLGEQDGVLLLLEKTAEPGITQKCDKGQTPIDYGRAKGHNEIVELLSDGGVEAFRRITANKNRNMEIFECINAKEFWRLGKTMERAKQAGESVELSKEATTLWADASWRLGVSLRYLLQGDFHDRAKKWALDHEAELTAKAREIELNTGKTVPAPNVQDPSFLELAGMTQDAPCTDITCPRDQLKGCSFADTLDYEAAREEERNTGDATFFLSWVWAYRFSIWFAALSNWAASVDVEQHKIFLWVCWFCNNQFRLPSGDLDTTFRARLAQIGRAIAMIDDWEVPMYLTRIWCVYEQYVAYDLQLDIHIIMPPAQAASLRKVAMQGSSGINRISHIANQVKCEEAEASRPDDKRQVLDTIAISGFDTVNRTVGTRLATSFGLSIFMANDDGPDDAAEEVALLKDKIVRLEEEVATLQGQLPNFAPGDVSVDLRAAREVATLE